MENVLIATNGILIVALGIIIAFAYIYIKKVKANLNAKIKELEAKESKANRIKVFLDLAIEADESKFWKLDLKSNTIQYLNEDYEFDPPIDMEEHFRMKAPEDRQLIEKDTENMLNGRNKKSRVIYHYINENIPGGYSYAESHVIPMRKNGQIVGIVGVERDITDYVLSQRSLKQRLEK
ncbi:MAG: hypothetical protein KBT15_02715 [Bacteroidales bacterium]|nr:hypothetical protein [Candidatus Minthousia equi]